jgi:hypothetical protein
MFQLDGKSTESMANQSCGKCEVLLALSFPLSYNFPVFLPHFNIYRITDPENRGSTFLQNTGTLIYNTVQKPKRTSTDFIDNYYYYVVFVVFVIVTAVAAAVILVVIAHLRGCL